MFHSLFYFLSIIPLYIHTVPTVILFGQLIEPPLSIIYLSLKQADSYNQYCPRPYRAATLRIWWWSVKRFTSYCIFSICGQTDRPRRCITGQPQAGPVVVIIIIIIITGPKCTRYCNLRWTVCRDWERDRDPNPAFVLGLPVQCYEYDPFTNKPYCLCLYRY